MVIFGGAYRSVEGDVRHIKWCNDLWTFDLHKFFWRRLEPQGSISPRDGHLCYLLPHQNKLIVFGGWTGQMKLPNAMQGIQKNDKSDALQIGVGILNQLDDAHFTDELWEYDFGRNRMRFELLY